MNNCLVKYEKAWEGFLDGILSLGDFIILMGLSPILFVKARDVIFINTFIDAFDMWVHLSEEI